MSKRSHYGNPGLHRLLPIACATAALALAPLNATRAASNLQVLHAFCSWDQCKDGELSYARLLLDGSGNLYGTTDAGGKNLNGDVFKLVPDNGKYKDYVIHNFCSQGTGPYCSNGSGGESLIMDVDGNLYGITADTYETGSEQGVVFKLTHGANGWAFKTVYRFCEAGDCSTGALPANGLAYAGQASGALWDGSSPLFGVTDDGGGAGVGTVYELVPGSKWKATVIHNFEAHGSDSNAPGPIIFDNAGNIYGAVEYGGKYNAGALYRLAAGTWTETTIHNFCVEPKCADGKWPTGTVVRDAAGDIFGTASGGGSHSHGVAFEHKAGGTYSVIYNFCSRTHCADGKIPLSGLVLDSARHLYGTTYDGGSTNVLPDGAGAIFELANNGSWSETVLYAFCSVSNCTDGGLPQTSLILGPQGNLFGVTSSLAPGINNYGTVFELTP